MFLLLHPALAVPPLPEYLLDAPDGLPTDGAIRTSRPPSDPDAVVQITSGPGAPFDLARHPDATDPVEFAPDYQVWEAPPGGWEVGQAYTAQFGFAQIQFTTGSLPAEPAQATLEIFEVASWEHQSDGTWTRDLTVGYGLIGDEYSWLVYFGSGEVPRPGAGVFRVGAGESGFSTTQTLTTDGVLVNACLSVFAFAGSGDVGSNEQACVADLPLDTDDPDATPGERTGCGCDGGVGPVALFPLVLLSVRRREDRRADRGEHVDRAARVAPTVLETGSVAAE